MSIWKNGKLIAGGSQALPLLSFMWADHKLNHPSWLRADTFSWHTGSLTTGVYRAAYAHLADDITGKTLQSETVGGVTIQFYLSDDGHKICPASEESNVLSIYNATGVAWYYIIDTTNQRFKLPRTKFGFTGIRSGVGGYVPESVPNIKGSVLARRPYASDNQGALSFGGTQGKAAGDGGGWTDETGVLSLNASNSSSAYQDNAPVQQRATEQYLYFYVGAFTQTALENTAGLNTELFNGKADVSTVAHVVTEFQEPTSANNYTWYRKYADGWVECGMQYSWNGAWTTISLPVAMIDANSYACVAGGYRTDSSPWQQMTCFMNYTATTVDIWSSDDTTSNPASVRIYICGMAA